MTTLRITERQRVLLLNALTEAIDVGLDLIEAHRTAYYGGGQVVSDVARFRRRILAYRQLYKRIEASK